MKPYMAISSLYSSLLFSLHLTAHVIYFILLLIALGFVHMHLVPNRDRYVSIVFTNIQYGLENEFSSYKADHLSKQYFPYDYNSIMHYSAYAYSKNKHPTITIPHVSEKYWMIEIKKMSFFSN